MASDYIPNTGTQLERAVRALLLTAGAVGLTDCFISNENRDRSTLASGITDILAFQSTTAEAEDSGNEKFTVRITTKYGAIAQPEEPNPSLNRIEIDKRIGKMMLALGVGNSSNMRAETCSAITIAGRALAIATDGSDAAIQDAANNEDMSDFTCLSLRYLGMSRGEPDDASCAWVEVRNFEISACPSNVD